MVVLVVKLADLAFLSQEDWADGTVGPEIIRRIRAQFAFLPGDVEITVRDGMATIRFDGASDSARTEAERLAVKAARRAQNGEFSKARDIYLRVLELDPAMASARRDLAMTLFELGDMEGAKNELIDALRFRPDDAWSHVVLANIYMKQRDAATAARFLERALALKPGDAYALNSLAAVSSELGDPQKALRCFEEAIEAEPGFPNAWFGKALLLSREGDSARALEVLGEMFRRMEIVDARSRPVLEKARRLYLDDMLTMAESRESEAFKVVEDFKAQVSTLSGYPVTIESGKLDGELSGVAQMAWKHGRKRHLVTLSDRLTPPGSLTLRITR